MAFFSYKYFKIRTLVCLDVSNLLIQWHEIIIYILQTLCCPRAMQMTYKKLHKNLIMFWIHLWFHVGLHSWLSLVTCGLQVMVKHAWKVDIIECISLIYVNLYRKKHLRLLKYSKIIKDSDNLKKTKIVVNNWVWITPHIFSVRGNNYSMVILQVTLKLYHLPGG